MMMVVLQVTQVRIGMTPPVTGVSGLPTKLSPVPPVSTHQPSVVRLASRDGLHLLQRHSPEVTNSLPRFKLGGSRETTQSLAAHSLM